MIMLPAEEGFPSPVLALSGRVVSDWNPGTELSRFPGEMGDPICDLLRALLREEQEGPDSHPLANAS